MGKQEAALGHRVRAMREGRTWKQDQVAQLAGVSSKTISNIENGKTVRSDNLVKVLAVFKDDGEQALRDHGFDDWADAVAAIIDNGESLLSERLRLEIERYVQQLLDQRDDT